MAGGNGPGSSGLKMEAGEEAGGVPGGWAGYGGRRWGKDMGRRR